MLGGMSPHSSAAFIRFRQVVILMLVARQASSSPRSRCLPGQCILARRSPLEREFVASGSRTASSCVAMLGWSTPASRVPNSVLATEILLTLFDGVNVSLCAAVC